NDAHTLQWDMSVVGDRRSSVLGHVASGCLFLDPARRLCSGDRLNVIWGQQLLRDKSQLQGGAVTASSAFDINDEGYVVPVGAGNTWRDGKTKKLWGTTVSIAGQQYPWGLPILQKDSLGGQTSQPVVNGNPALQYGFQNTVRYKALRLYGLLNGQFGGQVFNQGKHYLYLVCDHPDVSQSGKADEARKPVTYYRALAISTGYYLPNFVESATYARLSEASIGYVFDANRLGFLKHTGAKRLEIDLIARNLFTLTRYTGQNPQSPSFTLPVDAFRYPLSRTFTLATSLIF
ncbi:MAG: hypothetical protein M3Y64_07855, partial [Gemmatimonadota bacterium]|nr:hypothetical protein [Gemmatimonadota bacterium]